MPVLVGSLNTARESHYGKIFAKYIADPHNLFVISSDFCHWGMRVEFEKLLTSNSNGLELGSLILIGDGFRPTVSLHSI